LAVEDHAKGCYFDPVEKLSQNPLFVKEKTLKKAKYSIEHRNEAIRPRKALTDTERMETKGDHLIDVKQAVTSYAQSEKVKSGLIWICQMADQVAAMTGPGRQQGLILLQTLTHMVADESDLAGRITGDRRWHEIGQKMNMALVMIDSGVPQETAFHLTQALTRVTGIGGQAASVLRENGLF